MSIRNKRLIPLGLSKIIVSDRLSLVGVLETSLVRVATVRC